MPSGSCLCGHVKYEFTQTVMKSICHCISCRKISGSTFSTNELVPENDFKLISPNDVSELTKNPTIHEAGMELLVHHCPKCYAALFKTSDAFPGVKIIFSGYLEDIEGVNSIAEEGKPQMEIWVKYRVPWLKPIDGAAQFDGFPPLG